MSERAPKINTDSAAVRPTADARTRHHRRDSRTPYIALSESLRAAIPSDANHNAVAKPSQSFAPSATVAISSSVVFISKNAEDGTTRLRYTNKLVRRAEPLSTKKPRSVTRKIKSGNSANKK